MDSPLVIQKWKKQALIEMQKFEDKLNNKIKGLNCICEITNYNREITKQIEDIIDTMYVDISHINNFNQMIDDNIPISNMIKRKSQILISKPIPPLNITHDDIPKNLIEIINIIIKNGGDIHADNEKAIQRASEYGYLNVVKCLVKYGANIHVHNDNTLRLASGRGHLDVIEYLISHGANVHIDNEHALRCASMNGRIDIVKCLIEHGANVNTQTTLMQTFTALSYASNYGHLAIVELLINMGLMLMLIMVRHFDGHLVMVI
jgi:ankyrin repeat protein